MKNTLRFLVIASLYATTTLNAAALKNPPKSAAQPQVPNAPAQQPAATAAQLSTDGLASAAVVAALDPNCKTCAQLKNLENSIPNTSFKPHNHNGYGLENFLQKYPQQLAPHAQYLNTMDSFKACSHIQAKCTKQKCSLPGNCIRGRAGNYIATYEGYAALSYFMLMTKKEFARLHGNPTDDIEYSINHLWSESA